MSMVALALRVIRIQNMKILMTKLNGFGRLCAKDAENIMFWRPQKVGSSTLLSLLVSFGYRYNHLPREES